MIAPGLDWGRIAHWTQLVATGDLAPIARVFSFHQAAAPHVIPEPTEEQLEPPPLRFLLAHWSKLADKPALPHLRQIDALDLGPALGHVMLLDVVDGGRDFRYRLFGSVVARVSNFEMTGRLLSELPASPYVVELLLAVYRVALQLRHPVFSARRPVTAEYTARWMQIVMPLVDDSGAVARMLAGTIAVGSDGRIIYG